MAPTMKPKKPLKSMEKLVDKPTLKRKKKRNFESYASYLYLVLKSIKQDMGISKQAMLILNSFVIDTMETIATEASRLVAHGKKNTLSSRDIQTAVKLLIPGELGKHCQAEGLKAIALYTNSMQ